MIGIVPKVHPNEQLVCSCEQQVRREGVTVLVEEVGMISIPLQAVRKELMVDRMCAQGEKPVVV
jgi:hypothetical protein